MLASHLSGSGASFFGALLCSTDAESALGCGSRPSSRSGSSAMLAGAVAMRFSTSGCTCALSACGCALALPIMLILRSTAPGWIHSCSVYTPMSMLVPLMLIFDIAAAAIHQHGQRSPNTLVRSQKRAWWMNARQVLLMMTLKMSTSKRLTRDELLEVRRAF